MHADAKRVPLIAALITLALHLAGNPHYGFFRDELYFIICGRHPAIGYVDQPPIVPLLSAASQMFGHSLFLLRAIAAGFAAASVFVTCRLVTELGGGRFAQIFAAMAAALCPVLCAFGGKIGTDVVGLWSWPLLALYVLRMSAGADPRLWLRVGVVLGLSVLSKYSVLYFAVALLVALLCTPQRRILASRWFALGATIAILLPLPNFIWQAAHGFPMLELLRHGQEGKNVVLSPLGYIGAELLITNPILSLIWLAGVVWLLLRPALRFLGLAYLLLLAAMIASHAKHYYPAAVYPILFAAGATAVEEWTRAQNWVRWPVTAVAALAGLLMIPYVLPVLPVPLFLRYHRFVGPRVHIGAARSENARQSELPQDWADMLGWPELAATVARVAQTLTPAERAQLTIIGSNYGEAAAIDFFGADYGLPPALSGHNQYYLWGTRGYSGNVLIDLHGDCGASRHLFRSSEEAAVVRAPLAMPSENPLSVMLCRGINQPLSEIWAAQKFYY